MPSNTTASYLKQDTQCTHNVTMRRVRETIVGVENKYYILVSVFMRACACVRAGARARGRVRAHKSCSLANPACNAYAPCCDVIFGPSVSTIFFDIIS